MSKKTEPTPTREQIEDIPETFVLTSKANGKGFVRDLRFTRDRTAKGIAYRVDRSQPKALAVGA